MGPLAASLGARFAKAPLRCPKPSQPIASPAARGALVWRQAGDPFPHPSDDTFASPIGARSEPFGHFANSGPGAGFPALGEKFPDGSIQFPVRAKKIPC